MLRKTKAKVKKKTIKDWGSVVAKCEEEDTHTSSWEGGRE
jgi:hypothetical protein